VADGGTYLVTPAKAHYSFAPSSLSFSNVAGNGIANFTAIGADTVDFSSVDYSVSEEDGFVEVTVTRAGDISGSASVRYRMLDGTASQIHDYTLNAGVLSFAPLETSRTFYVLITNDDYVEQSQETVNLLLSDPSGFILGNHSSAVVTIVDNSTAPPTTNPIEDARTFVDQHYDDFLGRAPDQGGLDYWTAQIEACGSDQTCILNRRVDVSAAFFVESEFQQSGGFVYRVIKSVTGQRPDYLEFIQDRGLLTSFGDLDVGKQMLTEDYVTRSSFTQLFPTTLSKPEFIDLLIARTRLSTGVDLAPQRDFLLTEYTANDDRAQILRLVADHPLVQHAEFNEAFVLMQYFGYLRRNPDQAGYDFWLNVMNNQLPGNHRGMVCAFLTSSEFQQRFSPTVPRTNQDCGADQ
jgi:hypothetical protein